MRLVRILVVVVLITSVFMNVIMYLKWSGKHPILEVNGEGVSKRDLDSELEAKYGMPQKAQLVQEMLIRQAAEKQNVVPSDEDVNTYFTDKRDTDWKFAQSLQRQPWAVSDAKNAIRLQVEQSRLLTHDIQVTDDERKDEYDRHPQLYDTPEKAHVELAVMLDGSRTGDVVGLLQKQVSPTVISQDLKGAVGFIGFDNKMTLQRAYGDTRTNSVVFNMRPNDVRQLPAGPEFRGAKGLVVRLIDKVDGKKANLQDPKIKERLTINVAMQRAKPWQEFLSKLWADAKLDFEDQTDKKYVEGIFFPDRAKAGAAGK